jgi:predicted Zn finger-like uncharacterized protein
MANIRVTCPTCNAELEIGEEHLGKEVECGSCLQAFTAEDPKSKKTPYKMRRPKDRADDDEEEDRPSRRRRRDDDEGDYDYSPPGSRNGGSGSDAPGIIGLIFGCVAVVCLVLGCFTCGMTYFAAAPLALVGGIVSCFARGNLKVAGIVLNVLVLIPGILVLGLWMLGMGGAMVAPRR